MAGIKRALISVSNKTGVQEMAKGLAALGAEILSTGGTAKALREAGVKVTDVAAYTGSPEILDGRVKTLHPKIHGGLLGRRSLPAHVEQMEQHGIGLIDVVVVNLYPFEATIAKPHCLFEEAIENIDIGGHRCCALQPKTTKMSWWSWTRPTTSAYSMRRRQGRCRTSYGASWR